jgi:hypothetical protein
VKPEKEIKKELRLEPEKFLMELISMLPCFLFFVSLLLFFRRGKITAADLAGGSWRAIGLRWMAGATGYR